MLIIRNARLLSFHAGFQPGAADAVAIDKGRIVGIGMEAELQPLISENAETIDARGRVLMPGFNDSHIHVWKVGDLIGYKLDLRGVASLDEMLAKLEAWHKEHPDAVWITARGFNEAGWPEGRLPTAQDIDKVVPGKPVYIIRTCAHIAVTNSRAMEIAGIGPDTVTPPGGVIHRHAGGRPIGIFSETALGLITRYIPAPTKAELKDMFRLARTELYRYGVTAVTDPAVDPVLLDAYREMQADQSLGLRLNAIPILLPDGGEAPYPVPDPFSSEWLNVNMVKFFSDGGLSGQTAALKHPYKGSADRGVLRLDRQQFLDLSHSALERGLGIATHAIGDTAIEFVIDVYRELCGAFPGLRKRIEHLGLPEEIHLEQMARYDIATSIQAIFIRELGRNFRRYLDEEYLNRCYPIRSVLEAGILTALSSDAPVVRDFNPLAGAQAAVLRRDQDEIPIAAQESISVQQALRAYTVGAAAISNMSDYGSLEHGKLADLVLLDEDPTRISPDALHTLRVRQTFVGGESVYEAPSIK